MSEKSCEEHVYKGVPPCPVHHCPNGHDRQTYILYQMAGFGADDEITLGGRRIFLREWRRTPERERIYFWSELGEIGRTAETIPVRLSANAPQANVEAV
jgi:hypothetical protein